MSILIYIVFDKYINQNVKQMKKEVTLHCIRIKSGTLGWSKSLRIRNGEIQVLVGDDREGYYFIPSASPRTMDCVGFARETFSELGFTCNDNSLVVPGTLVPLNENVDPSFSGKAVIVVSIDDIDAKVLVEKEGLGSFYRDLREEMRTEMKTKERQRLDHVMN
jgi:hypothetical protein